MSKPVILTGLRSNNDLHIGNYLGAMLPMADMARRHAGEYQVNLFIPDLHSFTTPIDHSRLYEQTLNTVKMNVAAGLPLDQEDIYVYRQSFIPAHSELTWILSCFTYFGEMNRMTQFAEKTRQNADEIVKEMPSGVGEVLGIISNNKQMTKSHKNLTKNAIIDSYIKKEAAEEASVGLFNYPVLMAADILLYGAEYVPVGDDQTQHLEFTRDIADRMNNRFGELFTLPRPVKEQHQLFGKDQGLRIRDLIDPTKKMSKSDEIGKGVLFLNDSPDEARKKIKSATTDSKNQVPAQRDYEDQPGVSNLLDILSLLGDDSEQFVGQTQYGPLKDAVADKVAEFLQEFQSRLGELNETTIENKLADSEEQMQKMAGEKLHTVQQALGLRAK